MGGSKKLQNTLIRNIKMALYGNTKLTITTTVKVREQGVKGHNSPIFVEKERFEGVTKRRKNVNVLDTV